MLAWDVLVVLLSTWLSVRTDHNWMCEDCEAMRIDGGPSNNATASVIQVCAGAWVGYGTCRRQTDP